MKRKFKTEWEWGDKARLATDVGISPQYLSDILANRKDCKHKLAVRLELAAAERGYDMPRYQWVFPDQRANNPLFQQR